MKSQLLNLAGSSIPVKKRSYFVRAIRYSSASNISTSKPPVLSVIGLLKFPIVNTTSLSTSATSGYSNAIVSTLSLALNLQRTVPMVERHGSGFAVVINFCGSDRPAVAKYGGMVATKKPDCASLVFGVTFIWSSFPPEPMTLLEDWSSTASAEALN